MKSCSVDDTWYRQEQNIPFDYGDVESFFTALQLTSNVGGGKIIVSMADEARTKCSH